MADYMNGRIDAAPRRFRAINTSADVVFATAPRALYIGGAGNLVLVGSDGVAVSFAVPAGVTLDVMPGAIRSAGTSATGIVALD